MKYHRLCWYQGELFYDFPGIGTDVSTKYNTLVLDIKEARGWVSVDQYASGAGSISVAPVCRGIEIAASNLLIGIGGQIFNYTGSGDAGFAIRCRVVTRQDDLGDPRVQKFLGDYMMDTAAGDAVDFSFTPLVDYATTRLVSGTNTEHGRFQVIDTFRTLDQTGYLSRTVGFDLTWTCGLALTALYQYEIAFVPKPEFTNNRPTDPTDDGYNGAKYLRGLCIECNTMGLTRAIDLWVDDAQVQTLTVNADRQLEIPLAITPVVGSEFWLVPLDSNEWELFQIRWAWEKWPDYTTIFSPWLNLGTTKPKYVRGFSMPVDTRGVATGFNLTYMNGPNNGSYGLLPVTTPLNRKARVSFAVLSPLIMDQIQIQPTGPCRCWYDEIIWDAEEWPNLITEYYPFQDLGNAGAKYLRGFEVPVETNGVAATLSIRSDRGPNFQPFDPVTTPALLKTSFPFTPVLPMVGHEFQVRSDTPCRVWWQEIKWDFDPWPEQSDGRSAWTDMGTPGAKFLQGMVIPMDTNGQSSTIDLIYDNGQSVPLGPFTTLGDQKTSQAYSLPEPIIVHQVQLSKRSDIRTWDEEVKWIWEPVPELVTTYTTQPTDHDLPGWHYLFDCYIAYIGTAVAPTLTITTEYGSIPYSLPVANGTYTRAYLLLHPQKAKWRSYSIVSSTGLRLFLKDCEVRVKNWTDKGNYPASFQSYHPFGDESRVYGARI
jgi:hypothetical protein